MRTSVKRTAWLCAQPIDAAELAELERAGVIAKCDDGWIRLLQPQKLPDHLAKKVTEIRCGDGAVKIKPPTRRTLTIAARLGVNWRGPEPK